MGFAILDYTLDIILKRTYVGEEISKNILINKDHYKYHENIQEVEWNNCYDSALKMLSFQIIVGYL